MGYKPSRGVAGGIRALLTHLGIPWENKVYPIGPAPDFDVSEWMVEKYNLGLDFPNLPYIIDEDFRISETLAIYKYLCHKFKPEYLGTTLKEQAMAAMLTERIYPIVYDQMVYQCIEDAPEITNEWNEKIRNVLSKAFEAKGDNTYIVGDTPTYLDFLVYESLERMAAFQPEYFEANKSFKEYHSQFEKLEGMAEYKAEASKRNFNNIYYKINKGPDYP